MWLETYIQKKILDELRKAFVKRLKKRKAKLISSSDDLQESLEFHLKQLELWSSEISFKDINRPRGLDQSYIELDTYVTPRKNMMNIDSSSSNSLMEYITENLDNHNITVLGQPGAGKTTSVKSLCRRLMHKPEFLANFNFPVLIRLRDSNSRSVLFDLLDIFGFTVQVDDGENTHLIDKDSFNELGRVFLKYFMEFLDGLKAVLVIDGLDEIDSSSRRNIINELNELSISLNNTRFILTSRPGEYNFSMANCLEVEIRHLSEAQILEFSSKWFGDKETTNNFLTKVQASPFGDTAIRPLNLAHLLAIFERDGDVPEKPKTVYRKMINLLLEEWDIQRRIVRTSKYGNFEVDRKFEFLSHLSFELTTTYETTVFSREQLEEIYINICHIYNLPSSEVKKVVCEIEDHNGLIVQSGYESFEFSHKSLQEFLTASYLVGLKRIPRRKTLINIPNELAICIAISSNPTDYFADLILNDLKDFKFTPAFTESFIDRLINEKIDFSPTLEGTLAYLFLLTKYLQENFDQPGRSVKSKILLHFQELIGFKKKIGKLKEYYHVMEGSPIVSAYLTLKRKNKESLEEGLNFLPIKLFMFDEEM